MKNVLMEPKITSEDIKNVKERFGNKCFNCGKESSLCLDHFYPLSKGFSLTEDNCILLCRSCNSSKSNKHPFDFFNIHQVDLLLNSYKIKLQSREEKRDETAFKKGCY